MAMSLRCVPAVQQCLSFSYDEYSAEICDDLKSGLEFEFSFDSYVPTYNATARAAIELFGTIQKIIQTPSRLIMRIRILRVSPADRIATWAQKSKEWKVVWKQL